MDETDIKEQFEKAASFLRGIAGKLDSQDLLYFYARFKQANEGPCNVPKPGFFSFEGKQKWSAWKELGDLDRLSAMQVRFKRERKKLVSVYLQVVQAQSSC